VILVAFLLFRVDVTTYEKYSSVVMAGWFFRAYFYTFSGSRDTTLRKRTPLEFYFCCLFKLSKHEKASSFSFVKLVKTLMTSGFTSQAYAIPVNLAKNNRGTRQKWWGNKGTIIIVVGSMSLLNMALLCIRVWVGTSHLVSHLPPWVWDILFDHSSTHFLVVMTPDHLTSNTAKSAIVPPTCSREVDLCRILNLPLISHTKHVIPLCLVSMMWETLWPTFDQDHFLSTSAHYPGR